MSKVQALKAHAQRLTSFRKGPPPKSIIGTAIKPQVRDKHLFNPPHFDIGKDRLTHSQPIMENAFSLTSKILILRQS